MAVVGDELLRQGDRQLKTRRDHDHASVGRGDPLQVSLPERGAASEGERERPPPEPALRPWPSGRPGDPALPDRAARLQPPPHWPTSPWWTNSIVSAATAFCVASRSAPVHFAG